MYALTVGGKEEITAKAAPLSYRHHTVTDSTIDGLGGVVDASNAEVFLRKLARTCFTLTRPEPEWYMK